MWCECVKKCEWSPVLGADNTVTDGDACPNPMLGAGLVPFAVTKDDASWVAYRNAAEGNDALAGMLTRGFGDELTELPVEMFTWEPVVGLFASIPGFCFFHLVRRFFTVWWHNSQTIDFDRTSTKHTWNHILTYKKKSLNNKQISKANIF